MDTAKAVASALLEIGAVGFSPTAPVTFKSGIRSPVYVDNRRIPFHPPQWRIVIEGFDSYIKTTGLHYDIIAGVAVGGIPHSAALAYLTGKPSLFIRKEAKEHGTQKRVEGGDATGKKVLLVEDMVTTGGSSLDAVRVLRDEGAEVTDVIAIVSYEFMEAETAFAAANVRLHTLTNFRHILASASQENRLGTKEISSVEDWLKDPHGWAKRQGHI